MRDLASIFPERFTEEEVISAKRRHPILLAMDLGIFALLLATLAAAPFFLRNSSSLMQGLIGSKGWVVYFSLSFIIVLLAYARYYNWKYNWFIVTDQRVVDSNRYFPFRKVITEASLEKIQDSTFMVPGPLGSMFNFGNLRIETAGEASNFEWQGLPDPSGTQRILHAAIDRRGESNEKVQP